MQKLIYAQVQHCGVNYAQLVEDTAGCRAYLDEVIARQPELFPEGIEQGYCFHGFVEAGKLDLRLLLLR